MSVALALTSVLVLLAPPPKETSLEGLRAAVVRRPADAALQAEYAGAALEAGQLVEAEAAFRALLTLEPTVGDWPFNLGMLLVSTGNPAGGLVHLEKAVALIPGDPGPLAALGSALLATDRADLAVTRLAPARALGAPVLAILAFAELRTGSIADALTDAAEAARSGEWHHHVLHATAAIHAGRFDLARTALDSAAATAPATAANLPWSEALLALAEGHPARALGHFRRARQQAPDFLNPESPRFDPLAFAHPDERTALEALERARRRGDLTPVQLDISQVSPGNCPSPLQYHAALLGADSFSACHSATARLIAVGRALDAKGDACIYKAVKGLSLSQPVPRGQRCSATLSVRAPPADLAPR
ncbi:MAG: hypothetical protein IV100_03655 [Myxococcales bacterium]|nr:hypothetical protein [Myxococcales bacterium]